MRPPDVAVAISSHNRPLRLRWLLNALLTQTFPADRFEVLVAHDSSSPETEHVLATHPLAASGQLRELPFRPGTVMPGAKRNAAWRAARAPLILFTDDDCRPRRDWIERAVAVARSNPGAIIQGRTVPDPDEAAVLRGAPWAHTVVISPPTPWAETCNIVYPRELLDRIGGLDPELRVGEDTDLWIRARRTGASLLPDPNLVVYHAVVPLSLLSRLRALRRWPDMARLVKRHPRVRLHMWGGIWWKREHAALMAAIAGAGLAARSWRAAGLMLPWLALAMQHRGYDARGVARSITELPGRAVIDATEILMMVRGSVRHRTLLL